MIDTRNKRASCLGIALAALLVLPAADGAIEAHDRAQIAGAYAGLSGAQASALPPHSYGLYAPPQGSDQVTTAPAFRLNRDGYRHARQRAKLNGATHTQEFVALNWLCPTSTTRDPIYQQFVADLFTDTDLPVILMLAATDGPNPRLPSDLAALPLDDAAIVSLYGTVFGEINAMAPGRVKAIGVVNEADDFLDTNPSVLVLQMASLVAAVKTQAEAVFGSSVITFGTFTNHSVRDKSYQNNGYRTVARSGGALPAYTVYPKRQDSPHTVYDFTDDETGLGADFLAMYEACGEVEFAVYETGLQSGPLTTASAPGGGGLGTQLRYYQAICGYILPAWQGVTRWVTFIWLNDISSILLRVFGFTFDPYTADFVGNLGLVDEFGQVKPAYAVLVAFLGGVLGDSEVFIRPTTLTLADEPVTPLTIEDAAATRLEVTDSV